MNFPVPLRIIGFRSRAELLQYAPLYQGKPVDMAGFFEASPDRDFIALDLSTDDWSTALHEYTHALVHANFPPVPAWFDEGLAEYFATLKISQHWAGDRKYLGRESDGAEQHAMDESGRVAARTDWFRFV